MIYAILSQSFTWHLCCCHSIKQTLNCAEHKFLMRFWVCNFHTKTGGGNYFCISPFSFGQVRCYLVYLVLRSIKDFNLNGQWNETSRASRSSYFISVFFPFKEKESKIRLGAPIFLQGPLEPLPLFPSNCCHCDKPLIWWWCDLMLDVLAVAALEFVQE